MRTTIIGLVLLLIAGLTATVSPAYAQAPPDPAAQPRQERSDGAVQWRNAAADATSPAYAQSPPDPPAEPRRNQVMAHFGTGMLLMTRAGGQTRTLADGFIMGMFPIGILVMPNKNIAFDFELMPMVQTAPVRIDLTVHPGVLFMNLRNNPKMAAGVRFAFEVNRATWGFTPLFHYTVVERKGVQYFVEGVTPIRFRYDPAGPMTRSFGVGIATGVLF